VIGTAEIERHAETQIETARALQRIDQLFRIELRAGALQRIDQDVRRDKPFQRRVVGCLAGKYLASAFLYSSTALE
jgi:hypothetical protein